MSCSSNDLGHCFVAGKPKTLMVCIWLINHTMLGEKEGSRWLLDEQASYIKKTTHRAVPNISLCGGSLQKGTKVVFTSRVQSIS